LRKITFFFLTTIFLFFSNSSAQSVRPERQTEQKPTTEIPKQFDIDFGFQEKTPEKVVPSQQYLEQALEVAVDSNSYKLGPGDLLQISVWGILENQLLTEVTAEGYVVIPTISEIYVSGLTLADGSSLIKKNLQRYFKEASFSIRLIKMRKFRVYLVGEVAKPGTYYMRGSDRLSDLLEVAEGLTPSGNESVIQMRHANGENDTLNIIDFYLHGDKAANPYLNGGDVIFIPRIDFSQNNSNYIDTPGIYQLKKEYIYVKGEVYQPGAYPYMTNLKAIDYAGMAGMRETAQDVNKIYVIHSKTGEISNGGEATVMQGDIVVVPQRSRETFKDYLSILTPIISIGLSTFAIIQASK
jgi:protein involved in polysaccharide export with SLBB domain